MANATDALSISFDNGLGSLGNAWNVDQSVPGQVTLAGSSALMEWAFGPSSGHGYGTYTIDAKVTGNQPGPGIIFWPGDNQWPGQELDLLEITPDGSGRQYGTIHWNANGSNAYDAKVFDGVTSGVFHQYQMVWEAGHITFKVDGKETASFTDHVPVDFAHGGMNDTIGFINTNNNTSLTVRQVDFTPQGGGSVAATVGNAVSAVTANVITAAVDQVANVVSTATGTSSGTQYDSWGEPLKADGSVDWEALAATVYANHEATGSWFW